jgi:hypothetical protein
MPPAGPVGQGGNLEDAWVSWVAVARFLMLGDLKQ